MIAYIKGVVTAINEESIVIEANKIGYEIVCPDPFYYQRFMQKELLIHTYFHVRDDAQMLYGFKEEDEKFLFMKLISVSGIGPKSAISILSAIHVPDFIAAVENEDEKFLTQFPGVGKKTARQIILDLKGKLSGFLTVQQQEKVHKQPANESFNEAKEALLALGYTDREIAQIMPQLARKQDVETDEMVRQALQLLMKN
ncbi:MAG TPA: Holliday junction branch migration protein RuvA [Pseudogracilibacillus sp.]|nr:Holliday junction branch migration protein RuvA [Pseudogracilibacillus sp.]